MVAVIVDIEHIRISTRWLDVGVMAWVAVGDHVVCFGRPSTTSLEGETLRS